MTLVKFCGLKREEDIAFANELRPDFVGFVFWKKSRRYIPLDVAEKLKKALDPSIKTVGVFLDEEFNTVAKFAESGIFDYVQLHGSEDENFIIRLKNLVDIPVIKAFGVGEADFGTIERSPADYVMLDNPNAGSGKIFDREKMGKIERKYFLAGGLNPENVEKAIKTYRPFAVDVSSGIETDGKKDYEKMRAFLAAARKN